MTLWLLAVTPTRFPAATSATIIWAPVYVFPLPAVPEWRALRRRARRQATGGGQLRLAVPRRSRTGGLSGPRRAAEEEVTGRPPLARRVDPVLDDPLAEPQERRAMHRVVPRCRTGRARRMHRLPPRAIHSRSSVLSPASTSTRVALSFHVFHASSGCAWRRRGVVQLAAHADVVVLRREPVPPAPPRLGPRRWPGGLADGTDDLERTERALVDRQLGPVDVHAVEELPVVAFFSRRCHGKSCARSQRALLVACARIDRHARRQRRRHLGDARVGLGESSGPRRDRRRPRNLLARPDASSTRSVSSQSRRRSVLATSSRL